MTCGDPICSPASLEDTYTVLTRDFKASWLFLEKQRSRDLYAYLGTDRRFVPAFETPGQVVYDLRGRR